MYRFVAVEKDVLPDEAASTKSVSGTPSFRPAENGWATAAEAAANNRRKDLMRVLTNRRAPGFPAAGGFRPQPYTRSEKLSPR